MSLLDPWRQARAEIIASRPTYTPFYTPGDYAVTVGNPDTGIVDQVAPEVLPQVVQRQNEVMDDSGGDMPSLSVEPEVTYLDPNTGLRTADKPNMQIDSGLLGPTPEDSPGRRIDEENYMVVTTPGMGFTNLQGQIAHDTPMVGGYNAPVSQTGIKFYDLDNYYADRMEQQRDAAAGMGLTHPGPLAVTPGGQYPQAYNSYTQAAYALDEANMPAEAKDMGFGYTPGGVTYDDTGRAIAPALDPRDEPPSILESMGLLGSKDTRGGGQYDALGQSLTDPDVADARQTRDTAAMIARGFPLGTLFGSMISNSRAGDLSNVGPYSRDAFNNYRYNASGPMGTLMAPVGELMDNNDFSGAYGLGTVGNTGISATPAMFDDVGYKGGAFGYGYGFKSDGTFGSLNAVDVNDQQGIDDQMGRAGFVADDETGTVTGTTAMGDQYTASGRTGGIEDYVGGDDGGSDDGSCVIATHGVETGGFSDREKAKAEVWCQKKYHGKWWGELFRKGYQYLGNRAIERGKAHKYYDEFRGFIAYGRGLQPGLKHAILYYVRTVQFFATGAALTGVEQFQKLRKKIDELRNR